MFALPNMKNQLVHLLFVFLCATAWVSADPAFTPSRENWADFYDPPYQVPTELAADSELRARLFGLLRKKVSDEYRFKGSLKVFRNWAFFCGDTVDPEGKPVRFPSVDNSDTVGLWLKAADGWILADSSFGHSDAFFFIWPGKYGAPYELFGMEAPRR